MALDLVISTQIKTSCSILTIYDTTGVYDTNNTTGWCTSTSGGSNIRVDNSSIVTAYLLLTSPGGTVITIDLMDTDTWQAVTPYTTGAPFDSSVDPDNLYYVLDSNYLTTYEDGVWTVQYYVEDSNGDSCDSTFNIAMYCKAECGIYQVIADIPDYYTCETCDNKFIDAAVTLWGLLQSLKLAACSASVDKFNNILTTIQDILETLKYEC